MAVISWMCWRTRRGLPSYLRNEIRPDRRLRLEQHLHTCPDCTKEMEALNKMVGLLEQYQASLPSAAQLKARVLSALPPLSPTIPSHTSHPWWIFLPEDWTGFGRPVLALATVVLLVWSVALWRHPPTLGITGGQEFARGTPPSNNFPLPPKGERGQGEGGKFILAPGSTVTAQTGPITLTLPNVSLALETGSTVTVEPRETKLAALSVHLEEGTVTVSVVPGTPFTVKTPLGEARAKGTEFQVQLKEIPSPPPSPTGGEGKGREQGGHKMKRLMTVMVLAGLVEVQNGFGTLGCAAGETVTVEEGRAPRDAAVPATSDAPKPPEPSGTWATDAQGRTLLDGTPFTGVKTTWHPNGQKQSEYTYRDGRVNGTIVTWNENGQETNSDGTVKTPDKITLGARLKPSPDGLTVTAITPESPAARASLQVGDRLLTLKDQPISKTEAAFLTQLGAYAEGSLIKLVVERKEGRHTLLLPWMRQDPSSSGQAPVKTSKPVERPKK